MKQVKQVLDASIVWRWLDALCNWVGAQWQKSGIIYWFLHPKAWTKETSQSSVFYQLWLIVLGALRWVYRKLNLDRVFEGSIFCQSFIWCALPLVIAPIFSISRDSLIIMCLCLVGYCSLLLCLIKYPKRQLMWSPINRYILLYAAVYTAAVAFSVDLKSSLLPGLLTVGLLMFSLVIYNCVLRRSQFEFLIIAVVLVGTLVSCWGIAQYLFGWGYQSAAWVDSDMFSSISFRVPSTLDNPNMLGQYLILTIPLGGAKLLGAKEWKERILWLGCCGIMCICMILTFSRGAWLGLLFAGALFFVFLNPRLILLAPFALVALYFVMPETIISRFTSIGNMGDASTSYRVYIWVGVLAMLKDYWLCGIGPGTEAFNKVYPAYSLNAIAAPHSHNLYLQIVCDAGIAALIVFLLLIFVYFRMMCGAVSREKVWSTRLLQIAFTSGTFGFLIQAMTDYSFYNYRLMFFFWAYLALGALSVRREKLAKGGILQ